MNYKEFIKIVKDNKLKPVYLFFGEEGYLIDETIKVVKKTCIDENFEALNYIALDGKDVDFDKILNACETLPFMSKKKIVLVKDLPLFKSKKEAGEDLGEWSEPKSKELLIKYIESLGDYLCLIFVEKLTSIRKTNPLYKAISKVGDVVEFKKLRGKDLDDWIQDSFKKYNKKIPKSNINYFTQQSSYFNSKQEKTLYDLENEIMKISNYLSNEKEVTKENIDSLMAKPLEMNVFNLLNSISQKNGENAIKLFNEMYISGEPVLFILHMIVRQLRNMLNIKALKAKGYTEGQINDKIGLSKYEYRKVLNQSNNFTIPQLERSLIHCLETDKSIKTSSIDDRLALEILITNLCFKI